jgi:hypothetical protein
MADVVDTITLFTGKDKYAVRLVNISDGTGESAVVKLDKSAIAATLGITEPAKIIIEELYWNIQGFTSVRLYWDHDTDDELEVLCNSGYRDYTYFGGLVDPGSAGGTGDVLLTTAGTTSGSTYSIMIVISFSNATV